MFASCIGGKKGPTPKAPSVAQEMDTEIFALREKSDKIAVELQYCEEHAKRAHAEATRSLAENDEEEARHHLIIERTYRKQGEMFLLVLQALQRATDMAIEYKNSELTEQVLEQFRTRMQLLDLDEMAEEAYAAKLQLNNVDEVVEEFLDNAEAVKDVTEEMDELKQELFPESVEITEPQVNKLRNEIILEE